MTSAALATTTPVLRTASGEPPLGPNAASFRDDQGEIIAHNEERYTSSARVGVLQLNTGDWLIWVPGKGFPIVQDGQRYERREDAIEDACEFLMNRARLYMATPPGEGVTWSEEYGNAVIRWADSVRKAHGQGASADAAASGGHPGTEEIKLPKNDDPEFLEWKALSAIDAHVKVGGPMVQSLIDRGLVVVDFVDDTLVVTDDDGMERLEQLTAKFMPRGPDAAQNAGVNDDTRGDLAGEVTQPKPDTWMHAGDDAEQLTRDPVVRFLVDAHQKRKQFPAKHAFSMTTEVADGKIVSVATCICGHVIKFGSNDPARTDAAIEAHWRRHDTGPMVDGRGEPIIPGDASRIAGSKPRKRRKSSDGSVESRHAAAPVDSLSGIVAGAIVAEADGSAAGVAPGPSDANSNVADAVPAPRSEPAPVTASAPRDDDAGSPLSLSPAAGGPLLPQGPAPGADTTGAGELEAGQICPSAPAEDDPYWDDPFVRQLRELAWRDDGQRAAAPASYEGFLGSKVREIVPVGFEVEPDRLNAALKPFQRDIVGWLLRQGRAALFAGTGLGKTLQQLAWADQIVARMSGPVLVLTPLAVAQQTVAEAEKFGIASVAYAPNQQAAASSIVVTNYERLDHFDPSRFAGVVLDESSILKAFDGKTRNALTDAFGKAPFRLCCTATPAPNDYTELGNHAEFLGVLQYKEMLATWFVHEGSSRATNIENYGQRQGSDWRLKGHAHDDFWRWLASWSVMVRHPRDLGYEDAGYDLPALHRHQITISTATPDNLLGEVKIARTLHERLSARRDTIEARVAAAAAIVNAAPDRQWLVWCNLNDESSALKAAIPGAVEVRGSDDPDEKAHRLLAFARGESRALVSKPSIAGWGMNFQRCADMVFVGLNDSFEQLYQAIRRCWRFGQTREVNVHLIAADVEGEVVANLQAKEEQAAYMAEAMAGHMRGLTVNNLRSRRTISIHDVPMQLPGWLKCA